MCSDFNSSGSSSNIASIAAAYSVIRNHGDTMHSDSGIFCLGEVVEMLEITAWMLYCPIEQLIKCFREKGKTEEKVAGLTLFVLLVVPYYALTLPIAAILLAGVLLLIGLNLLIFVFVLACGYALLYCFWELVLLMF